VKSFVFISIFSILTFFYDQTQQALSVEDEGGAGVSGDSVDERGELGRADATNVHVRR